MQNYRLGADPAEFAHPATPKKKIRGYVHATSRGGFAHVMAIDGVRQCKMENASDREGIGDKSTTGRPAAPYSAAFPQSSQFPSCGSRLSFKLS